MAVVIDSVLLLQLLDVAQGRFRMRPDAVIGMQQHLLETAVDTHALVFGEILEQRRETFSPYAPAHQPA